MRHPDRGPSDIVGYDPETGTYHTRHDWTAPEPLSHTVTLAVSTLTGDKPSTGRPLANVVDTDALDNIFTGPQLAVRRSDHVQFVYQSCRITVYRDGHVVIQPPVE